MAPRRNPDIVVAVLWEHGNWGNNSAKLAAQVINAFVTKQRKPPTTSTSPTPPAVHPSARHLPARPSRGRHKISDPHRRIARPSSTLRLLKHHPVLSPRLLFGLA